MKQPTAAWPPRETICLDCRAALPAGTPCPAGHSRTSSLRDQPGREKLLTEVWGPKSIRQRALEAGRAGAASGGGGTILDGCSGCDLVGGDLGSVLMVIALFIAAGILIWAIGSGIAALVRRRRGKLNPSGASHSGASAGLATGRTGTVLAPPGVAPEPVAWSPCVAFATALDYRPGWWRSHRTMLRDSAALEFEVMLDSGQRVRIPRGPIVLDMTRAVRSKKDPMLLEVYLGELDPARGTTDDFEPFPCHRVRTVHIAPGDRVEVLGVVESRPAPGPATGSYRTQPATFLTPTGIPHLRRL